MRSDLHNSLRRRISPFAADRGARPVLEAAAVGVPLLLLLIAGTASYLGDVQFFSRIPAAPPSPIRPTGDVNRHRLGSILFVPWTGVSTCEERRFDNLTGQIVSDGVVACEFPPPTEGGDMRLRLSDERVVDGQARMRAILEAFKK